MSALGGRLSPPYVSAIGFSLASVGGVGGERDSDGMEMGVEGVVVFRVQYYIILDINITDQLLHVCWGGLG